MRITALWPVLISRLTEGRKLSWPGCPVTYRDGMYARPKMVVRPSTNQPPGGGWGSNSRPPGRQSNALTTRQPRHHTHTHAHSYRQIVEHGHNNLWSWYIGRHSVPTFRASVLRMRDIRKCPTTIYRLENTVMPVYRGISWRHQL